MHKHRNSLANEFGSRFDQKGIGAVHACHISELRSFALSSTSCQIHAIETRLHTHTHTQMPELGALTRATLK